MLMWLPMFTRWLRIPAAKGAGSPQSVQASGTSHPWPRRAVTGTQAPPVHTARIHLFNCLSLDGCFKPGLVSQGHTLTGLHLASDRAQQQDKA